MKRNIYLFIISAILIVGIGACSQTDELDFYVPGNPVNGAKCALLVTVNDGGYVGTVGNEPLTRVVENGYSTRFEAGDVIGVFLKKTTEDGNSSYENVKLTYSATGEWTGNLYYYPDLKAETPVTYTAYYPYSETITDEVSFNAYLDNFTPAVDQSTADGYTKSDLRVGVGTLTAPVVPEEGGEAVAEIYKITFSLGHKMALCIINLPIAQYTLTTDANYKFEGPAPAGEFGDNKPYYIDAAYRYLVKPLTAYSISGSYSTSAETKKYTVLNENGIALGSYKVYKVDPNNRPQIPYTLQVGDYFMKDGSLASKDAVLTDNDKKNCIGIVFQVDASRICDAEEALGWKHGYVMALKQASAGCMWWNNSGSRSETYTVDNMDIFADAGNNAANTYNDLEGYRKNQYIINTYGIDEEGRRILQVTTEFEAFYHAAQYGKTEETANHAAPVKSSGWYMPSSGQWWDIIENLAENEAIKEKRTADGILKVPDVAADVQTRVNGKLEKLGKINYNVFGPFWLSTENTGRKSLFMYFTNGELQTGSGNKNSIQPVRCILAF